MLVLVVAGSNVWVERASRGGIYSVEDVPVNEVALVLGAGVYADGTPQPFLAARLDLAAELLRRGKVTRLLLTGDGQSDTHDEPAAMRTYLLALGVPDEVLMLDPDGVDTYASCVQASRMGLSHATLVSQTYHLPRALALCRAVGIDAVAVGEETMREKAPSVWASGQSREIPAAVKAAWNALPPPPAEVPRGRR
ncbi:MAG: ElyC/SanA/YdcF family protein [Mobilicoccus sp.]|nr:ElyC/SanA/YdcF family protein [Mobilicoccus sp.]